MLRFAVLALTILFGGCASTMRQAPLIDKPSPDKAIVTFVRPSILFGDGSDANIWDGRHFIGALGAGRLVQYETSPGSHLFMANIIDWSYVQATLEPGKQYFLKLNFVPGVLYPSVSLGVAKADDPRIVEWLSKLEPMAPIAEERNGYQSKKQNAVDAAIAEFESGKIVSFAKLLPQNGVSIPGAVVTAPQLPEPMKGVPDVAARLQELDLLRQKGLVTEEEFQAKRTAILDTL